MFRSGRSANRQPNAQPTVQPTVQPSPPRHCENILRNVLAGQDGKVAQSSHWKANEQPPRRCRRGAGQTTTGDAPEPTMGQQTDEGKDGGGLAFRGRQMECSPGGGDCIDGDCIVYPRPSGNSDRTTSGRQHADRRLRASLAMPPSPSDHLPTDWRHEPQTGGQTTRAKTNSAGTKA